MLAVKVVAVATPLKLVTSLNGIGAAGKDAARIHAARGGENHRDAGYRIAVLVRNGRRKVGDKEEELTAVLCGLPVV